ncbi:peroxidase-like [Bacillus rossius redtenbacheri]|uniref:peroxidase-like n=1 Tax=Bacillus rossius redtenbacheri TaxID=93214 RepID=UPI002FDD1ACD
MDNRLVWLATTLSVVSVVSVPAVTSLDPSLSCEPDTVPLVTRGAELPQRTRCPFAEMMADSHSWQAMLENSHLQQVTRDEEDSDEPLVQPGTPEYGLFLTNRAPPSSRKRWSDSRADLERSRSIAQSILEYLKRFTIPQEISGNMLSSLNIPAEAQACPRPPKCTGSSRFRSIDGSCNNFKFTDWGQTNTALRRLLSARYSDGVSQPPVSGVGGKPLPNSRVLSTVLSPDKDVPDRVNTLMVMQIGQMISHDTALSPDQQSQKANVSTNCCGADGNTAQGPSGACIAIEIPRNDSFYSQFDHRCMSVVRSMTTVSKNCHLGPAEQFSAVTHFVDASNIYGSEDAVAESIRLKKGGKLITQVANNGRHFPPNSANPEEDCDIRSNEQTCYTGGDVRINQHPQMSVLQVLFLREHNRLADILSKLNPHWDDERLYFEARRIVIGVWQHIVYIEWLPIVLGQEYVKKRNLTVLEGYSSGYDIDLDPSTLNSFTTGCFRTFHSMVQGNIRFFDDDGGSKFGFPLREWFDRPSILHEEDKFDRMLRGLAWQPAQSMDPFTTQDLTNFLFKHQSPFGLDLAAIDIQRSRDHGLRSYNDFRELCELPRASNFSDFSDVIDKKYVELLSQLYAHVDDVDMMVGIKLENLLRDTVVGKTCQCIIGEQFFRWKFGDLWFYDFKENPAAFTPEQLKEIKKSSLSKVICDNGDQIKKIPRNSFLHVSKTNVLTQCDSIPSINFKFWKESA